jgi:hypothetical protein
MTALAVICTPHQLVHHGRCTITSRELEANERLVRFTLRDDTGLTLTVEFHYEMLSSPGSIVVTDALVPRSAHWAAIHRNLRDEHMLVPAWREMLFTDAKAAFPGIFATPPGKAA